MSLTSTSSRTVTSTTKQTNQAGTIAVLPLVLLATNIKAIYQKIQTHSLGITSLLIKRIDSSSKLFLPSPLQLVKIYSSFLTPSSPLYLVKIHLHSQLLFLPLPNLLSLTTTTFSSSPSPWETMPKQTPFLSSLPLLSTLTGLPR